MHKYINKSLFFAFYVLMCVSVVGCKEVAKELAQSVGEEIADKAIEETITKPVTARINKKYNLDIPFQVYDKLSDNQASEKVTLTIDDQVYKFELSDSSFFKSFGYKCLIAKSGVHKYSIKDELTMKDGTVRYLSGSGEIDVPSTTWKVFELQLDQDDNLILEPTNMEPSKVFYHL